MAFQPAELIYELATAGEVRSVNSLRLCAPAHLDMSDFREELGFDGLADAADAFTVGGTFLRTLVPKAPQLRPHHRVQFLAELLSSIGESLTASVLGASEAAFLAEWSEEEPTALRDGHFVAERFLWESVAQMLVGAGHRATNLMLHLALMDSTLPTAPKRLRSAIGSISEGPESTDDPESWVSESDGSSVGNWLLVSGYESVRNCGRTLLAWIGEDAWRHLVALRGRDHHRWRPATPTDGTRYGLVRVQEIGEPTAAAMHRLGPLSLALSDGFHAALSDVTDGAIGLVRDPSKTVVDTDHL